MLIWCFFDDLEIYDYVGKLPKQHFSLFLFSNPGNKILLLWKFNKARISEWNIAILECQSNKAPTATHVSESCSSFPTSSLAPLHAPSTPWHYNVSDAPPSLYASPSSPVRPTADIRPTLCSAPLPAPSAPI